MPVEPETTVAEQSFDLACEAVHAWNESRVRLSDGDHAHALELVTLSNEKLEALRSLLSAPLRERISSVRGHFAAQERAVSLLLAGLHHASPDRMPMEGRLEVLREIVKRLDEVLDGQGVAGG